LFPSHDQINEKIKELSVGRDALKMKAFSCGERIKELEELNQEITHTEVIN